MIIFDNHLHLRRDGRFLDAVRDFKRSGGTHFVLCQLPMTKMLVNEKSYLPCFQHTLSMAEEIRSKIDVGVFVTVGPYPVDYLVLRENFGRDKAVQVMEQGMDYAAVLCEQGLCIAIGEIGRPHFPVDEQVINDCNAILFYGMKKAKEVDVPVVLHTESTTPNQCKELVKMGEKAGLSSNKIVKHYSPPLILKTENYGLMPSVIASRKNILTALDKGTRFMMETDYIDDPERPGAVLGPKTVPRRTRDLMEKNLLTKDDVYIVHQKNPEQTYNITLEG